MASTTNKYGLYFPIFLESGAPLKPGIADSIDSSLRIILSWDYFSRYFTHKFGSILYRLVSEPNTDHALTLVKQFVIQAVIDWEKRLEIQSVSVTRDDSVDGITIDITAFIKESQTIYSYTAQL